MLNAVILAAGMGKRFNADIPKSLMPLDASNRTTLSIICSNLLNMQFHRIFLIIGANYGTMKKWISENEELNNNISNDKNCNDNNYNDKKVEIIDARSLYQKGPLFSFQALKNRLKYTKPLLIFPADTWYSVEIWKFLENRIEFLSNVDEDILFYAELPKNHKYGTYAVIVDENKPPSFNSKNFRDEHLYLNSVIDVKPKEQFFQENPNSERTPQILPFMILSAESTDYIFNLADSPYKNIFQVIRQKIKENGRVFALKIDISRKNPMDLPFFVDLDFISDYEFLRTILS